MKPTETNIAADRWTSAFANAGMADNTEESLAFGREIAETIYASTGKQLDIAMERLEQTERRLKSARELNAVLATGYVLIIVMVLAWVYL